MFGKKLAVLAGTALALTVTTTAFADHRDYRDGYRHNRHHHHYYRDRIVVRPIYERPVYVPRPTYYYEPAPTYYYTPAPAYYAPAPVYYGAGPATVGGALAGAIIGNQIADRHHRGAATVAGALIGGAIGSSIDYRY